MYTDEQLEQLEQDERVITEEAMIAMLLVLVNTKLDIQKEIRAFYQKYGKDGVVTYSEARKWVSDKDHRRRITALLSIILTDFDILHSKLNPKFDTFLTKVINKEVDFFDVDLDIEDILDTAWGVDDSLWYKRLAT